MAGSDIYAQLGLPNGPEELFNMFSENTGQPQRRRERSGMLDPGPDLPPGYVPKTHEEEVEEMQNELRKRGIPIKTRDDLIREGEELRREAGGKLRKVKEVWREKEVDYQKQLDLCTTKEQRDELKFEYEERNGHFVVKRRELPEWLEEMYGDSTESFGHACGGRRIRPPEVVPKNIELYDMWRAVMDFQDDHSEDEIPQKTVSEVIQDIISEDLPQSMKSDLIKWVEQLEEKASNQQKEEKKMLSSQCQERVSKTEENSETSDDEKDDDLGGLGHNFDIKNDQRETVAPVKNHQFDGGNDEDTSDDEPIGGLGIKC